MPKVYSYSRWSTAEQSKGDSFRRQTEAARKWAAERGLELDEKLNLYDPGVSAYRGSNVEEDRGLGAFVFACKRGLIERGSYLLVESLDRVSRMTPRRARRVIDDIVDAGVTIVTLNDGQEYSAERLDNDHSALLVSLLVAWRAHEESRVKGQRVAAAWAAKRDRLQNGDRSVYSRRAPAWLRYDGEKWQLIDDRADVIRRIFSLTRQGWGEHRIAETLNREAVPPFGRAKHWHRSSVAKLLRNPAVIGQAVPGRMVEIEGKLRRETLSPVDGVYPAVVSLDEWAAVQSQKHAPQPRGRHGRSEVRHALAGLARCPLCDAAMTRVHKGSRTKPKLVCTRAKVGAGCAYHSVPVDIVEDALRDRLWVILNDLPAGDRSPALDRAVAVLEMRIAGAEEYLEELHHEMDAAPSVAIGKKIADTEALLGSLRRDLEEAETERHGVDGGLIAARVHELQAALTTVDGEEVNTPRLNAALRSLFEGVVIDWREGVLVFRWRQGGEPSIIRYTLPASLIANGAGSDESLMEQA